MFKNKFSSIKWRFIVVYFLLVFIAMVIVGMFIIGRLETQQIENVNNNMEKNIENMVSTSSYFMEDEWEENMIDIQRTIDDWRLDNRESLYVISLKEYPKIIATSSRNKDEIVNKDALPYEDIESHLLKEAQEGKKATTQSEDKNEGRFKSHIAYPVEDEIGKVKGIIYMTYDLENVMKTVQESKIIITNATLIALAITITLGYFIADSIVEPIRDVTKKAEEMAEGDFDQKVDVKSDDEIGQLASMFNYLTDELKDRIREIDIERSKLDTIFNYMAEGVVAIDIDGNIIHANPVALDILNMEDTKDFFDYEELVSFPYNSLNFKEIDYNNEDSLKGDQITEIDGEIYKIKYAPFRMEKENIGGLILVFQNMTNEHNLDNMRKEFVANVSHELKTPITTIKSYTETLMLGGIEEEMQLNFLNVIDDECDRMDRLVRDLLQLSNMDFKATVWDKTEVEVNEFVEGIVDKVKITGEEKDQKFTLFLEKDIPNIYIDRDAIEQVLLNILSNSIKYTEENGNIKIITDYTSNFVSIKIKDDGVGIPSEDIDRIFERFYRVEKARSRDSGGTGLGLSIAKEIVEGHNGYIEIESKLDEGTKVEIKLPYDAV